MLEARIADVHAAARTARRGVVGVRVLVDSGDTDRDATGAAVLVATTADLVDGSPLLEECFGPTSVIVEYESDDDLVAAAQALRRVAHRDDPCRARRRRAGRAARRRAAHAGRPARVERLADGRRG